MWELALGLEVLGFASLGVWVQDEVSDIKGSGLGLLFRTRWGGNLCLDKAYILAGWIQRDGFRDVDNEKIERKTYDAI